MAKHEKARRGYSFSVPAGLVERLREHLAHKAPAALAFSLPRADAMADMVRADLATARDRWIKADGLDLAERVKRERSDFLAEKDSGGGVFDFHALRATFVTNLARSGVSLFHASKLARHTDPQLTAKVYAKLGISDEREALAKVPSLTADPDPAAMRATGTAGGPSGTPAVHNGGVNGPQVSPTGREGSGGDEADDERKPLRFPGLGATGRNCPEESQSHLRDLNPGPMLYESIALPLS